MSCIDYGKFTLRRIRVSPREAKGPSPCILLHYAMTSWPDHGVPELDDFLQLLQAIRVIVAANTVV
jgi:protein tyrosine phosphatase